MAHTKIFFHVFKFWNSVFKDYTVKLHLRLLPTGFYFYYEAYQEKNLEIYV